MKIFIPSWVKSNPAILLNNKMLGVNAKAGTFCTLKENGIVMIKCWSISHSISESKKIKDNDMVFAIF